jgi:hypothetical protein
MARRPPDAAKEQLGSLLVSSAAIGEARDMPPAGPDLAEFLPDRWLAAHPDARFTPNRPA